MKPYDSTLPYYIPLDTGYDLQYPYLVFRCFRNGTVKQKYSVQTRLNAEFSIRVLKTEIIRDFKIGKLKYRRKQTLFLLLKKIENNNRLDQSSSFIEKRPNI